VIRNDASNNNSFRDVTSVSSVVISVVEQSSNKNPDLRGCHCILVLKGRERRDYQFYKNTITNDLVQVCSG
jgi:hypothetical protein